jgi:hypothetical protein
MRFLTQMYVTGSYCTCPAQHYEVVTEPGRVQRSVQYTLPGVALRQKGPLPDLSQVAIRVWGTVIDGPGGVYALSVHQQTPGDDAQVLIRRVKDIRQGQEFEITGGPQDRIVLQTRTPYVLSVEGSNPNLHPQQQLTLQGRACFYLATRP